ncbi:hypothetical protein [Cupriavidus numazuensis]|uniref:Uncharacterized protein n=1 Tax=Cupriavidus numazuensis TaxID=221992 RepID=A0ABM8TMX5_9BURK|nr:hypothetical protein [Cupriavidus numazuensis]CAG2155334.1 hypothetical protein LMG26411_04892 [Cupriavidus numazuensis]
MWIKVFLCRYADTARRLSWCTGMTDPTRSRGGNAGVARYGCFLPAQTTRPEDVRGVIRWTWVVADWLPLPASFMA